MLGEKVQVDVETRYLADQSDPEGNRFVFAYYITITNHNSAPVQLLRRHWLITNGDEQVQEVEGEGVVGEQPVIEPQQSYSYSSGTVLSTRVGSMQGEYLMQADDGTQFETLIKPFTLALPNALH